MALQPALASNAQPALQAGNKQPALRPRTPAFLGELASQGDTVTATTCTITLGASKSYDPGDLLVVAVNSSSLSDTAQSCADSQGNTWTAVTAAGVSTTGSGKLQMFVCVAAKGGKTGDTITVTGNSARRAAKVFRFGPPRGTSATVLDVTATATNVGSTAPAAGPMAQTAEASLVLCAAGFATVAGTVTKGAAFPSDALGTTDHVQTNNGFSVALQYRATADKAAESGDFTLPGSAAWACITTTLKADQRQPALKTRSQPALQGYVYA